MTRQYDISLTANVPHVLEGFGRFLRVLAAPGAVAVRNYAGSELSVVAGQQYEFPEGIGRLAIQSTATGTLSILLSFDPTDDGRASVSGSVNVANFPAVQTVDGTVNVGNFPAVQTVDGTVNVGNFPAVQTVDGAVDIGNFPAVQTVDGTVDVGSEPPLSLGAGGFSAWSGIQGVTELIAASAGEKTVRTMAVMGVTSGFIYMAASAPANWNSFSGAVFAIHSGESFNLQREIVIPDGFGLYVGHEGADFAVIGTYD